MNEQEELSFEESMSVVELHAVSKLFFKKSVIDLVSILAVLLMTILWVTGTVGKVIMIILMALDFISFIINAVKLIVFQKVVKAYYDGADNCELKFKLFGSELRYNFNFDREEVDFENITEDQF